MYMHNIFREFGFPTPDIVYDFRKWTNSDFANFADYGVISDNDMIFSRSLHAFHYMRKNAKEKYDTAVSEDMKSTY